MMHLLTSRIRSLTIALGSLLVCVGVSCAQQVPPSDPLVTDPVASDEIELIRTIADADGPLGVNAFLDALEAADGEIRTFAAEVMWDRRFRLQGDRHVRIGKLFFSVMPALADGTPKRRTFAVRFEELYIDDIVRTEQSHWVFDGEWLYEKDYKEKTFIARRLAREGEPIDPLRLGEGPIPLPIGQKKDEILSRYVAELLEASDGIEVPSADEADELEIKEATDRIDFVADAIQLRLVPKEWYERESEFREIRLWYEAGSLLPRMALTINRSGDQSFVQLINIVTNERLPAGAISAEQPDETDGWRVEIDPGRFTVNNDEGGES